MAQTKLVDLIEHHLELPGEEFVSVFLRHSYWTFAFNVIGGVVWYNIYAKANNLVKEKFEVGEIM